MENRLITRLKYLLIHNIHPERATLLRESLIENRKEFVDLIKRGVDNKRLLQIQADQRIQQRFKELAVQYLKGGRHELIAESKILSFPPDLKAGYLQFYEKYLTEIYQLKFVSSEDDIDL